MSVLRGQDLSGKVFDRLTVLSLSHEVGYMKYYKCLCSCGNTSTVSRPGLLNGSSKSCGCLRTEMIVARSKTHGLYYTPEYRVYTSMINRCTNPKYKEYDLYGGRGITVSDKWDTFEKFIADMGNRPKDGMQLDRLNNEKGYEPGNVAWVSKSENARNKRNSIYVEFKGKSTHLKEVAEILGIDYHALYYRYTQGVRGDSLFRPSEKVSKTRAGRPTEEVFNPTPLTAETLAKFDK